MSLSIHFPLNIVRVCMLHNCSVLRFYHKCRGILMTSILIGDLFITLYLTTRADRILGRRNVLITGALLKVCLSNFGID